MTIMQCYPNFGLFQQEYTVFFYKEVLQRTLILQNVKQRMFLEKFWKLRAECVLFQIL